MFRTIQFIMFYMPVVIPVGCAFSVLRPSGFPSGASPRSLCGAANDQDDSSLDEQALEALRSLADFHDGQWQGRAKSFKVTADVAAGIVQRRTSPTYNVSVKLGLDVANRDFTLSETLSWEDKVASRKISLQSSNVDVDAVDGSYSLDETLPQLPADLCGTPTLAQFLVEHCLAVSDDCRARCWAMYGVEGSLIRVVVSREERVQQSKAASSQALTATDLLEMQSDIDRLVDRIAGESPQQQANATVTSSPTVTDKRMERLVKQSGGQTTTNDNGANGLSPYPASLLEMSAGVWLGDIIIRDHPNVPITPEQRGRGFGATTRKGKQASGSTRFAEWSEGVQKIAWRWMWNFGEELRQVNDIGTSMGAELIASLASSLTGSVCVNEGLSRRIPKDERMVYVDWGSLNDVSFLLESFSIQVPRFLNFDRTTNQRGDYRPLSTEFAVFQSAPTENDGAEEEEALPKLVCSKSLRVYNYEGLLKQGCTSFFTFKRFGTEKDDL